MQSNIFHANNTDTDSEEISGDPASSPTTESAKRPQSRRMKVFVRKATADRGSDSTSNEERVAT